jgi:hypothetical protein
VSAPVCTDTGTTGALAVAGVDTLAGVRLLPPGYAVVGALLMCPLPLEFLRSLLVVSPSFPSDVSRSRVFAPSMDDGDLCSICYFLLKHASSCYSLHIIVAIPS